MSQTSHPPHDLQSGLPTGAARPWQLVLLLAAICFLAHFNRVSMAVAGDMRIMPDYGISPTRMGMVYSVFLAAYTLAMIPGGWVIDRFGPRFALAVVCLGSAVFVALTGLVGVVISTAGAALMALVVIRAVMGAVSAPLHPAAAKAVALGVPVLRRSAANGIVTGAALLGVASTFVVFGGLVDLVEWPYAFLVAALATGLLGFTWSRFAGEAAAQTAIASNTRSTDRAVDGAGRTGNAWSFARRHKNLLLLTCSYGAVGYFQYLFFYWMHYYFETVLELDSASSKYYAAIPPLAMAVAMPLGGWLSDRVMPLFGWRAARAGVAGTAMAASAALLLLGIRATEPVWIVVWLSLALGVLGMAEGPFWVTAVEVGGNRGGLSAAIFNTGGNAGGILAPVATPWISDAFDNWQYGIGAGSLVCLVGAALWIWIDAGSADSDRLASEVAPLPSHPAAQPGSN